MGLSSVLSRITPPATIAAAQRARDLRDRGIQVISLTTGQPDFDTPAHIKAAAIRALERGETKYTPVAGITALREAISQKFERDNRLSYEPSQIIVTTGAKQAVHNALFATLEPGDEVIVPLPCWVSYPDIVKLCGARPVLLPTSSDTGFKLRPEALERAITPRTKWFLLNSPCNPTGAAYGRDELKELTDVLRRAPHVHVLSDDIYEHLVYDGRAFCTPAEVEPELAGRTVTVNGLSKAHAMTGWRIGFAAGPREIIRGMELVQSQQTSGACSIAQWAGVEALSGPQDHVAAFRSSFERRRNLVLSILKDAPGLACGTPEGAFYVFANCSGLLGRAGPSGRVLTSDEDLVDELLERTGVATVNGAAFGLGSHVRLSFAVSDDALESAARRIVEFCRELSDGVA